MDNRSLKPVPAWGARAADGSALRFAEFVIDLVAFELRRDGRPVRIEPQVFDLIVFLASHPRHVLSKGDIIDGVWHGRAVSDSAISTRINAARRALGDDGTTQRFIKTVHGRGFRFEVNPQTASSPDQAASGSRAPSLWRPE